MGEIARALGMGSSFEFEGKRYQVSPWTYKIQGDFELYLEEHALKTMKRMKGYLSDREYADLVARTREDIDTGKYSFGSENIGKALNTQLHTKYLFYLMLNAKQPVAMEVVERMFETAPELIMEKMAEANVDPTQAPPTPPTSPALVEPSTPSAPTA